MVDRLAAIVEKPSAQATIGALRAEGVYDDTRSVVEYGDDAVAIPVTESPVETDVRRIVEATGPARNRTLADQLEQRGWTDDEIAAAPSSWAVLGSVVLVDADGVERPGELGEALLALVGGADTVIDRGPIEGPHREPTVEVIAGEGDTETVHREHGTVYAMDLATVMFSPGNKRERARMGELAGTGEHVIDMFAGIGYFALPIARAGARVTAVERNPAAFQYLLENTVRNDVTDRIEPYRADCRDVIAAGTDPESDADTLAADRIVMGHYDAHEYLDAAMSALSPEGVVHLHAATPATLVPDRPYDRLREAAAAADRSVIELSHRVVKTYSEGVEHVVVDAQVA